MNTKEYGFTFSHLNLNSLMANLNLKDQSQCLLDIVEIENQASSSEDVSILFPVSSSYLESDKKIKDKKKRLENELLKLETTRDNEGLLGESKINWSVWEKQKFSDYCFSNESLI